MEIKELEIPREPRNGFVYGLLGSLAGAAFGAVIWAAVAIATDYELGIIAWALGGLAGYGMARGHSRAGAGAGLTAAIVSLLAIAGARVGNVSYVLRAELATLRRPVVFAELPSEQREQVRELARRDADLRTQREQRCPHDDPYTEWLYEAAAVYAELSEDELAAEMAKYKEWRLTGRFADLEHVRQSLPYLLLTEQLVEVEYDHEAPPPEEWERVFREARVEAEALDSDEQLRRFRRWAQARSVASMEYGRRSCAQRLPWGDRENSLRLYREVLTEALNQDETLLAAQYKLAEEWDDVGQWQDPAFLRDRLVYVYASQDWCEREGVSYLDPTDPGPAWNACVEQAEQRAAQVPDDALAELVRKEDHSSSEAAWQDRVRLARWLVFAVLFLAVGSTLGAMDLLFAGLAVVTAYRVATGGRRAVQATEGEEAASGRWR